MSEAEFLAYIAGFIDADGSISIVTVAKTKKHTTQISACNCNKAPINMLKKRFGGKIRERTWKNKKWKKNYEWKLTALKAAHVIRQILPYLTVKKTQAEIVLKAQELKSKYTRAYLRWHPETKVSRDAQLKILKQKCMKLNERGVKV